MPLLRAAMEDMFVHTATQAFREVIAASKTERTGGYACLYRPDIGYPVVFPHLIGALRPGDDEVLFRYCSLEKPVRLSWRLDYMPGGPWTCYAGRDDSKRRWGGAVYGGGSPTQLSTSCLSQA